MPLTALQFRPGVDKTDTEYAAVGRWVDMDNVRFVNGAPEKIGGWAKLLQTQFSGLCRGLLAWRDNQEYRRLAVGTSKKLYRYDGGTLTNITPFTTVATTTLGAGPLATSSGSATVTVTHAGHGQKVGDNIVISGAVAVGGITPDGLYLIQTVPGVNSYTITHQLEATSTTSGGGSAVVVKTFRGSVSNPFSTTNLSTTVTVDDTAHGRAVGDTVNFDDASAVGGITVDGEYTVIGVATADQYTITHSSAATSTAGPGGGTVSYQYEVSIGLDSTIQAAGYGVGSYGTGTYGTPRSVSVTLHARTWSLDNFGEVLIANFRGGDLYEWIPNVSIRATPINNAPTNVQASFVTEERHVVALGPEGFKLDDQNSDRDFRDVWLATDENEARTTTLIGGNELISGRRLRGNVAIVWTDTAAFARQYTFDDFIRSHRRIGGRCGLVGPLAAAEMAGTVYWMSPDDFFMFDGASLRPIGADDVRDYVFQDINLTQRFKFCAVPLQQKGEVRFYYCSSGSSEIDRYVIFHVNESARFGQPVWAIGMQARTAGIDRDLFDYPIMAGTDGYLYSHESGVNGDGSAIDAWIRFGAFDIVAGEFVVDIDSIIADFKRMVGDVTITLYTRDEPLGTEETNGPYTITTTQGYIDLSPRVSGRQVAGMIRSNVVGGDFRLGRLRADVAPSGERS